MRALAKVLCWLTGLAVAGCSQVNDTAGAPGRFYTWMDAQGRLHTQAMPATPAAGAAPKAAVAAPAPTPKASVPAVPLIMRNPSVAIAAPSVSAATSDQRPDLFAPDDAFVDSAVLESNHFQMEKKKKFGLITDASGRTYQVYFEPGDGTAAQQAALRSPVVAANVATAVEPGQAEWPLAADCCSTRLTAASEELSMGRSYHLRLPQAGCSGAGQTCRSVVFELPRHPRSHVLRLYSYLSSLNCSTCLQWPTVVVLDSKLQPRHVYAAQLGGYQAESWYGFASFHFDVDISDADDAYLMLFQSKSALIYKNKRYQGADKGEIAFALMP